MAERERAIKGPGFHLNLAAELNRPQGLGFKPVLDVPVELYFARTSHTVRGVDAEPVAAIGEVRIFEFELHARTILLIGKFVV